ncbi:MAG: ABC transporter ATP-binding protein [Lachnospiraceae bacterium]|nr:ABC transporter ATP-binding protein [Lachnospiraceae bacterium]
MSETVIETTSLTKAYGTQISVDHINLHVRRGTIYGLLGRNGAGKTTTMKMLLGLINPNDGKAFVLGKDIQKEKKKILSHIGASIETPGFYANLTGRENLQIFSEYSGRKDSAEIKNVLEQVGLPYRDKKIFSQYSLGMKQRLAIACAIMHNPDILILDEPTNGLDPIGISEMRAFIKNLCEKQGKTILISSHILQEIEMLADDIGIIDKGKLIEESSKEELSIKREKYIKLQVSDTDGVVKILRDQYQSPRYKLSAKGELLIYDSKINIEEFVRDLIMAGIGVREVGVIEENLESYFIRVTGGMDIGEAVTE